jgi:dCTP deaminase
MILCDKSLKKLCDSNELILNHAYDEEQIQPASIDLRLAQNLTIPPGGNALGSTIEYVQIPASYVGRVEGKSSWGRLFLAVHITAGYIDPGFCGEITLEFVNFSKEEIYIPRTTLICQLCIEQLDDTPERLYGDESLGSHYQGQTGVTPSYLN